MMKDAIILQGLTKHYGSLTAVDHVSLSIEEGEVFGFLGPNGAGKTTTIRMLVGLTTPSEGTASVAGYDIIDDIVEVKRRVGVVPEASNLYDELTAQENLLFIAGLYHVPRAEREQQVQGLLKTFDLWERRNVKFGRLSKGLKRRLTVAASLIHQPEIIFLDEPTTGLDVMSARSLRVFLKGLGETGATVFLTTHYIEEADQLCDRIAVIVKGRIATVDTPENMKSTIQAAPVVEASFSSPISQSAIKSLEAVGEVKVEGNRVKILTKEVSETMKALTNIVTEYGVRIIDVNTLRPSLEDAFVRLTGVESEAMRVEKERGRQG